MNFVKITAIIRPEMLNEVEKKLRELSVSGISVSKVTGYGEYANLYARDISVGHTKIEIFTSDVKTEQVISAILEAAHTGLSGDGIVTVQLVEKIFRIRTGTEITSNDL